MTLTQIDLDRKEDSSETLNGHMTLLNRLTHGQFHREWSGIDVGYSVGADVDLERLLQKPSGTSRKVPFCLYSEEVLK